MQRQAVPVIIPPLVRLLVTELLTPTSEIAKDFAGSPSGKIKRNGNLREIFKRGANFKARCKKKDLTLDFDRRPPPP